MSTDRPCSSKYPFSSATYAATNGKLAWALNPAMNVTRVSSPSSDPQAAVAMTTVMAMAKKITHLRRPFPRCNTRLRPFLTDIEVLRQPPPERYAGCRLLASGNTSPRNVSIWRRGSFEAKRTMISRAPAFA